MAAGDAAWDPLHPGELAGLLGELTCFWWLAGGWALELYTGQQLRSHADTDIEIPREALPKLRRVLPGWDLQLAHDGRLTPWDGLSQVEPPISDIWCRPVAGEPWRLQVMLATVRGGRWHYRRDERISRPLAEVTIPGPFGLRLLAPEIQLLYKSRNPRPKDEADFIAVVDYLEPERRAWLAEVFDIIYDRHPWSERLALAGGG